MIKISLLLSCLLLLSGCNKPNMKKDENATVSTEFPKEKIFSLKKEFNGVVESPKIVQIKNRVDGYIEKQYFKNGSYVKKGELLYKIDDKPLLVDLNYAKSQLKIAYIDFENFKNIFYKIESSYKNGGSSKQDLETSETNMKKAEANIEILKANINKINLNIEYSVIKAPVSGFIEETKFYEGSYINAGTSFLTNIYSTETLLFSVMIPSSEKPLTSDIEVNNKTYKGSLSFCNPMSDESSGLVKCKYIFKPKEKIEINTFGKISFEIKDKGMFIPQTALVQSTEGKSIFIYEKGMSKIKPIKTGAWVEDSIQILEGVTLSDEIIVNGLSNVRDQGSVTKGEK